MTTETEKPHRRMGELVIPIPKLSEQDEEILKATDGMTDGKEVFDTITKLARQQGAKAEREKMITELLEINTTLNKRYDEFHEEAVLSEAILTADLIRKLRKGEGK